MHLDKEQFLQLVETQQTAHCYVETIGGHTWRNRRLYLSDFLKRVSFTSPDAL